MRRREEKRISTCEKKRKDERVGGDLEDEMAPDRLQLGAACFASVKGQNKITKSKKKKKMSVERRILPVRCDIAPLTQHATKNNNINEGGIILLLLLDGVIRPVGLRRPTDVVGVIRHHTTTGTKTIVSRFNFQFSTI